MNKFTTDLTVKFASVLTGVEHGFFGRTGGVSKGIYASLNAGPGSLDNKKNISENRRRIACAIGTKPQMLLSNQQIHSNKVALVTEQARAGQKADAFVTNRPGIAITALSADCAPVLFADKKAGIIGAAHAGWRGAIGGITDATIRAMLELGASRKRICAAIGPCISKKNYEVGEEFFLQFINNDPDNRVFFTLNKNKKFQFDIKAYLLARLNRAGLENVDALADCTYGQNDEFFSYRYNIHQGIKDYGRNISVIIIK